MAVQTIAQAAVIVHPDFSKFESGVKSFAGRAAGAMGAVTAAVTGAGLAGLVTFGLKSAASLEQAQVGFATLLGSGKKAQSFLAGLQRFAAATPFELPGLIESSRTLLGVGVNAKSVVPLLTAFGDAAGAVGVGQEGFQRIILATSQAISAGKFQVGDLNQIMTNGIPIYKLLSEALHKPVPEIRALASQGKLLAKDVLPVLQKQMEKDYGGAMAKQSQTLAGVWSTLKDSVAIGLANAIKPLVPLLENFVPKAANAASKALAGGAKAVAAFVAGLQLKGDPRAGGFIGFLNTAGTGIGAFVNVLRGEGTTGSKGFVGAMEQIGAAVYRNIPRIEALGAQAVRLSAYLRANAETIKNVVAVIGLATAAYYGYRGALYSVQVAQTLVNTAQKAWAATQSAIAFVQLASQVRSLSEAWILLDAAMDANPIGVVVAAITVLAGGLYLLWTRSATFRKIVEGAWNGIRIAAVATAHFFTGVVWPALQAAWNGIATGALWLWHNAIQPAWNGIMFVVKLSATIIQAEIHAVIAVWHAVAAAATWLYQTILAPIFHAIGRVIQAASAVVQLAFAVWVYVMKNVVGGAIMWLYRNVVQPVFGFIKAVITADINAAKFVLTALYNYIRGPIATVFNFVKGVATAVFHFIRNVIVTDINVAKSILVTLYSYIRGPLTAVQQALQAVARVVWNNIKGTISGVWASVRGVFSAMATFIEHTIPNAFNTGVKAIGKFWGTLKAIAKAPITFVVNSVINPLIGGFNKLAKIFHTPTIDPIHGFAEGGRIPGSPSSRDNRIAWLKNKAGRPVSNIAVATGEFIVNARDTAKALPLLNWINKGMKGGPMEAARRLGRPLANEPGDGSEGWAFAKGGLVGFLSDVWGALSNPVKAIKSPLEALINQIPGGGEIRDVLVGMGHKLIDGFFHWATSFGGSGAVGGGNVIAAQNFVRAQAGKPYVWASAGPGGYDCSGIVSAVYNVFKGKNPYSHTFSTESLPGSWFLPGPRVGPLVAGWSHPGQAPASASVGHMAGQIGGLPFESTGSRGVRVGGAARRVTEFANVGVARAHGGIVELAKIARADFGQVTLDRGHNLIYNGTGRAEPLVSPGAGDGARMHPDDIQALAYAIGAVVGSALTGTIPATRAAARQIGKRPG